jgi:hypothetical protein
MQRIRLLAASEHGRGKASGGSNATIEAPIAVFPPKFFDVRLPAFTETCGHE